MEAANRILRYLKTTPSKGLMGRPTKELLRPILILTGQGPLLTGNPPLTIVLSYGVISKL